MVILELLEQRFRDDLIELVGQLELGRQLQPRLGQLRVFLDASRAAHTDGALLPERPLEGGERRSDRTGRAVEKGAIGCHVRVAGPPHLAGRIATRHTFNRDNPYCSSRAGLVSILLSMYVDGAVGALRCWDAGRFGESHASLS